MGERGPRVNISIISSHTSLSMLHGALHPASLGHAPIQMLRVQVPLLRPDHAPSHRSGLLMLSSDFPSASNDVSKLQQQLAITTQELQRARDANEELRRLLERHPYTNGALSEDCQDVWMLNGWKTVSPIGRIKSVYPEKFGTPRQGSVVPDGVASLRVQLGGTMDARHAVEGLSEYSHVWLVWAAHLNGHRATQSKVRAPKLRGGRAGVFATRSPFRPNPFGLSLVRLRDVSGDTLHFSGIDLVDGTPVSSQARRPGPRPPPDAAQMQMGA